MDVLGYALVGIVAGVFSGLLGIGGGTVAVPALVFFFGFTQHKAQGTLLASFLLPVVALSVWRYHQAGNVHWFGAAALAAGLLVGGWFGAGLSLSMPETMLKRVFGVFLLFVAAKLLFGK